VKQIIKSLVLTSIIITFAISIVIYIILPDRIAVHFDSDWNITRYGNKAEVFIVPIALTVVQILYVLYWQWIHALLNKRYAKKNADFVADRIVLISSIIVSSTFASISILANYHMYIVAYDKEFPLLVIASVFISLASILISVTRRRIGWILAVLPALLLSFGLLNLLYLGIVTAIASFYLLLLLYVFFISKRSALKKSGLI
jgi:uncharacterized membrane protein